MKKRLFPVDRRKVTIATLSVLCVTAAASGVYDYKTSTALELHREYIGDDQCLDQSPYNVDEDARIISRRLDGHAGHDCRS
ncbi:MAG TPA: hypothetical protein VK978_03695 [Candidatus Saccharimonadales bacterium]|nr:hypothetical protein [Candidatus Saccharimonadales bacterium]